MSGATLIALFVALTVDPLRTYIHRAKMRWAKMNLRKIFDGSLSYRYRLLSDHKGKCLRDFPRLCKRHPTTNGIRRSVRMANHRRFTPTRRHGTIRLGRRSGSLSIAFYHMYTYESSGSGTNATFTIKATRDSDCDGKYSTLEVTGTINHENEVEGALDYRIVNPEE